MTATKVEPKFLAFFRWRFGFATVAFSRTNAYAQTGLMFYFQPADKKNRFSHSHNYTLTVIVACKNNLT
jgi:hypothetical protein